MKRTMMLTAVAGIFVLCLVSTVRAQGYMDLAEEGKQVVAAAKFMMSSHRSLPRPKTWTGPGWWMTAISL